VNADGPPDSDVRRYGGHGVRVAFDVDVVPAQRPGIFGAEPGQQAERDVGAHQLGRPADVLEPWPQLEDGQGLGGWPWQISGRRVRSSSGSKIRDVANANKPRPTQAAQAIQDLIPFKFSTWSHFPRAWKPLNARPPSCDAHPERTRTEFCLYDRPHNDYPYTQKFVEKAATAQGFRDFLGVEPVPKRS
jgi:hypothetical protein